MVPSLPTQDGPDVRAPKEKRRRCTRPHGVPEASGSSRADQTTSPGRDQMSFLGRVQMVAASGEGKVRVTPWVKLEPPRELAAARLLLLPLRFLFLLFFLLLAATVDYFN